MFKIMYYMFIVGALFCFSARIGLGMFLENKDDITNKSYDKYYKILQIVSNFGWLFFIFSAIILLLSKINGLM